MATRKPKATGELAPVALQDIGEFAKTAMYTYGVAVNEDRAIPSFEDGLKPVQRRILWVMGNTARSYTKTARVSGNVAGALHPHGTASISGAIITAVNAPVPFCRGDGNWGDLLSNAAADRYTNVKLSAYGATFMERDYLAVTPMMPNYDDREEEPIVLPALLPNILFNDNEGIGLGVTTKIPNFTPTSVLKILLLLIDKKKVSLDTYCSTLELFEPWGGRPLKNKVNAGRIRELIETGKASVQWVSVIDEDRDNKRFSISRWAPSAPIQKACETLQNMPLVDKVYGGKGLSYVVQVKRSANFDEYDRVVAKAKTLFSSRKSYSIYVGARTPRGNGKFTTRFHSWSVPELLENWLNWRVGLEHNSIGFRIDKVKQKIKHVELLIHACDHLDIIFKALRGSNPDRDIAKGLKITLEEAKVILALRVRQLSKLDQSKLKGDLKALTATLNTLIVMHARPSRSVKTFFERALREFEAHDQRHSGCRQWWLKSAVKASNLEEETPESSSDPT